MWMFWKSTGGAPKGPLKRQENEELVDITADGLSLEERMYLENLERHVASGSKQSFAKPPGVKRPDQSRVERNLQAATFSHPNGEDNPMVDPKKSEHDASGKGSYQQDPRYRDFYDRLKKSTAKQTTSYDEEVHPMSLKELDEKAWNKPKSGSASAPAPEPQKPAPQQPVPARPITQVGHQARITPSPGMEAGAVMRFDDDSVAVYRDAVSGKDYALFYFLEPGGVLAPRGIFVQQYEFQRIGKIPEALLEQMCSANRWDRDAVIFHLDKFEYAAYIRRLDNRTPNPDAVVQSRPAPAAPKTETQVPLRPRPEVRPQPAPPERDPLERGRVIRINVAGKVWEAVYWTTDQIGAIVAHDTNREWSLMHLNLTRFKDSLEYGDLLSLEKLNEIEASLARSQKS